MSSDSEINISLLDDIDFTDESFCKFVLEQYIKPNKQITFPNDLLTYLKQVSDVFEFMLFDEEPQKYEQMQHYEKLVNHLTRSYTNHLKKKPKDKAIDSVINDELIYFYHSMLDRTDSVYKKKLNNKPFDYLANLSKAFHDYEGINDIIKLLRSLDSKRYDWHTGNKMQLMKHYDILKSNLIALFLDDSGDTVDNDINKKNYRLRVLEQLQYFKDVVRKQPPKDYNQLKSMNINEPNQSRKSPRRAKPKSNPIAYLMTNFLSVKKYDDSREKLKTLLMSINNDSYSYKSKDEERELKHHLNNLFDTLTRHELKTMLRRATNQMPNDEDKLDMTRMTGAINDEINYFIAFINKSNSVIVEEDETDDDDDTNDNDNDINEPPSTKQNNNVDEQSKEEAARNELNNFSSNKTMSKPQQPKLSSQFDDLDDWSSDNGQVDEDTIKYTRTPARQPMQSYYDDADENPQPIKSPFKTFNAYGDESKFKGDEFDDYIKNGPRKKTTGRRDGKDMERVNKVIGESFQQENFIIPKQGGKSISKFREMLVDMIINGNYRIKYIPNAAARDTAEVYCLNSVDENGKPRYRLLPTNAKDPVGNDITDLNGDGVDDIVIIDKAGNPVIVNGYKIVYASPYKKVWKSVVKSKEARKELPFNKWLEQEFQKSIDNVDWEAGVYKLTKSKNMAALESHYKPLGLGAPRMSKRITPNSYWSAVFSKVWKLFWESASLVDFLPLKRVISYLSVASMIFAAKFDAPFKAIVEQHKYNSKILSYEQWSIYKKEHKQDYNVNVGQNVEQFVNVVIKPHINLETCEWQNGMESSKSWTKHFVGLINEIYYTVFAGGFNTDPANQEKMQKLALYASQLGSATSTEIKVDKNKFVNNINKELDTNIYPKCGYRDFKLKKEASKQALIEESKKWDIDTTNPE